MAASRPVRRVDPTPQPGGRYDSEPGLYTRIILNDVQLPSHVERPQGVIKAGGGK